MVNPKDYLDEESIKKQQEVLKKRHWLAHGLCLENGRYIDERVNPVNGAGGQTPAAGCRVDVTARGNEIVEALVVSGHVMYCGEELRIFLEGVWARMQISDERTFTAKLRKWLKHNHPYLLQGLEIDDFAKIHRMVTREDDLSVSKFPVRGYKAVALLDLTRDFVTRQFREHRAKDYLTVQLKWTSEQIANPPKSEEYERFINMISCGNKDRRRFLMATAFVAITHFPSKMIPYFWGPTNTGKTTFVQLIREVLPDVQPVIVQIEKIDEKFALQLPTGSSVATSGDYSEEEFSKEAVAMIKQISGEDAIATNVKHNKDVIIEDKPLVFVNSNFRMRLELLQNDETAYARFWQLRFYVSPEKVITLLFRIIKENAMPCFVNEIFTIGDELVAGEVTLEELFEKAVNADLSAVLENEVDVSSPDTSGEEEAVDPEEEAWQETENLSEEQAAIRRFTESCTEICAGARTATSALYAAAKDFDGYFTEMDVAQFGKLLRQICMRRQRILMLSLKK